jgi:hypothetical protein
MLWQTELPEDGEKWEGTSLRNWDREEDDPLAVNHSLEISPKGDRIAVGDAFGRVLIWEADREAAESAR